MKNRFGLALLASGLALSPVVSGAPEAALEKVYITEAGGTLEVAPDGSVASVTVGEGLDERLRKALAARIGKLRFEPVRVGGEPVKALTGFHVDLAGRKQGEEFAVAIDGIDFVTPKGMKPVIADGQAEEIKGVHRTPPTYPREQLRAGWMARLKLALRIAPDGSVADLAVVDSMLIGDDRKAPSTRLALRDFEQATSETARRWRFKVPASGSPRSPSDMTVITSVEYVFALRKGADLHKPGQWLPVHRAPKRAIAWLPAGDASRVAETAVAAGEVSDGDNPFRLVAPIAGTPLL